MNNMNYEEMEEAVVNRLKDYYASLSVRLGSVFNPEIVKLPENEKEFSKAMAEARITVAYVASSGADIISTSEVVQEELVEIVVLIESRKLRGNTGVYALLQNNLLALLGYAPDFKSFQMSLKQQERLQKEDDINRFSQTFRVKKFLVTDADELGGVAINQISFNKN